MWMETVDRILNYKTPWAWKVDVLGQQFNKESPGLQYMAQFSMKDLYQQHGPLGDPSCTKVPHDSLARCTGGFKIFFCT